MVKNFSDCTGFQDDSDDFQGSTANRGPGNVAAQTFQFAALVHGARTSACRLKPWALAQYASIDCGSVFCAGAVLNVNTFYPARGPSAIR
ncbi:hypothetical protein [Nitrosomonas sp. Nm33]|uniref:hypothetical protein n=1 Tax=Nitrosomonas sp. Nm33 TaxID=133724 RepID=UPI000898B9A5|nr:hypothetical protein [Nitrosomonas sp. Nm33]SDY81370.1 hypothetical protein SAMN05421755_105112 [Nitrosomonas sp. Nm33]